MCHALNATIRDYIKTNTPMYLIITTKNIQLGAKFIRINLKRVYLRN